MYHGDYQWYSLHEEENVHVPKVGSSLQSWILYDYSTYTITAINVSFDKTVSDSDSSTPGVHNVRPAMLFCAPSGHINACLCLVATHMYFPCQREDEWHTHGKRRY